MQQRAHTVIVGAGIVGVSAAWELARGGLTDVLVVDRGPLFQTGGSTSHAPGGIFQNNASRTVSKLAQWSVETFLDLNREGDPVYFPTGSLEIATTPERWADLHRKAGFGRANGLDARLLNPAEVGALWPLIDTDQIFGAIAVKNDGILRAVPAVERIARRAEALGVRFQGETRVTGFDLRDGRVRGVITERGEIVCEQVLICCGIWGPLLGKLAGVPIPLQPCAHPFVRSTPLPELDGFDQVQMPLWRHQDHSMYLWQDGARIGVGSYRHEPFTPMPETIRDDTPAPADLPFDPAMMASGWREAQRLVPALRRAEVTDRVYGMFSFTPDAHSLIGEAANTRGLWVAEAIWVTHGPGAARAVASLMLTGGCELDLREADLNRFAPHAAARSYMFLRGAQQYREVYDIIHPRQQIAAPRGLRRTPFYDRQRELGGYFFESNGWERPQWFAANADLPLPAAGLVRDEWSAREWSPIAGAEHQRTRDAVAMFDMSTFMKVEISGPGALAALETVSCSVLNRPPGRVTYALLLNARGGVESDVTILRQAEDRFLLFAGSGSGPRDFATIQRQTRDLPGVTVRDVTSAWCALGLWGPSAPVLLPELTEDPGQLDRAAFPDYQAREIMVAGIPVLAIRMSYVGEDGWELHTSTEYGGALWDALWTAGARHGLIAAGGAAMDSLRLERGFRALGTDLRGEYTPEEAGLGFAVSRKRTNYLGRAALIERAPVHRLALLVLDDPDVVLMGKEPVLAGDTVIGYVTSANFGYTVGQSLALAWLPAEHAAPGNRLSVEYFGRGYPGTVTAEPVLPAASERAAHAAAD